MYYFKNTVSAKLEFLENIFLKFGTNGSINISLSWGISKPTLLTVIKIWSATISQKKRRFTITKFKCLYSGGYSKLGARGKIQIRGPQNDVTMTSHSK